MHFSKSKNSTSTSLMTMHRPSNVDDQLRVKSWLEIGCWAKGEDLKLIFPIHPRTKNSVKELWGNDWKNEMEKLNVFPVDPVGYVDLLELVSSSPLVVTDSGGVQECYSYSTPSVVIRSNTEWVELLENGCAVLCPEPEDFFEKASQQLRKSIDISDNLYGDGNAAKSILKIFSEKLGAIECLGLY